MRELLEQFSHSEPWNQSVPVGYNFMETNSLLMESGEKYVVLISKQYAEFLKVMENIPVDLCMCSDMCVCDYTYIGIYASSYIKSDGQLSFFFLYILGFKYLYCSW